MAILNEEGVKVEDDFSTEQERQFGKIVKQKYNTDYYIIHSYPDTARPFYTMPKENIALGTNSFDFFMRGEEILSGAQRIHDPFMLIERIKEKGIDPETVTAYIDAFKLGAYPHGGCGIGLERLVMLYLGMNLLI